MRRNPAESSSLWREKFDAARRLGVRPVLFATLGRGPWARLWLRWRLRGGSAGGQPPTTPGWAQDLMAGADIRPLWEANRWAELPRFAMAGQPDAIAPWLEAWLAANPAFQGPNWACGQEAALRALHLGLAAGIAGTTPPAGIMGLLARRIGANPFYAVAQDNNHPISEAAGLLVCGLALRDAPMAARGSRRLDAAIARLVAADGSFAQPSPAYHRLLLDVAASAEWLARRAGAPSAAPLTRQRLAAATRWLHRLVCPVTGRLPRIGHQDGSHVADLAGAGPDDARPSLERAARLFCDASAGFGDDPGCMALGLACPPETLAGEPDWRSLGFMGRASGQARAILRTGPLRFRPGHADLLHLDLWLEGKNLLRDGGTGAYNPEQRDWIGYFQGAAAHNLISFDGEDQMPRLGPFLLTRWPDTGETANGAWLLDHRGRFHGREVFATPNGFRIVDRIAGPFGAAILRWRLAPGNWRHEGDGVVGPRARLRLAADGPLTLILTEGMESLAYGEVSPIPVLEARWDGSVSRITTMIELQ